MPTLIPAYGRDYKSAKAVIQDYEDGKDFILLDPTSQWNGMYCSIRDFRDSTVLLRYQKKTKITAHSPLNRYYIFHNNVDIQPPIFNLLHDAISYIKDDPNFKSMVIEDRWGTEYRYNHQAETFKSV